jgi:hypothetical protein
MPTLKELCESHKMFTFDNIPAEYNNGRNHERFFRDNPSPIPDFLLSLPNVETGIYWKCSIQDEGTEREYNYVHDYPEILVKSGDVVMRLTGNAYRTKGKYGFRLPYFIQNSYHELSKDKQNRAAKGIEEPNMVGVWSEKKFNSWVLYVDNYKKSLDAAKDENKDGNEAILKEIADFIATVPTAKVSVGSYNPLEPTTTVRTKHFVVTFKHYKNQAYLRTEIEYKGNLQDVSSIENA